ncbi:MAG TPA: protein-methionine-sulfoxide reductase heme-binding subunit MsrQ [Acidobacteriota bacterium]|nr:protein-methionine-sulfoxide reductase heme-binding subunit MsrQ [Acidobacteriota bacterium]
MSSVLSKKWIKAAIFLLCLAPVGRLSWLALRGGLGANPIEYVTHDTGDWTLIYIVLTLSITPARKLLAQPQLIRFRRMLGLFAFFYGCLHFSTYLILDKFFDISEILQDVGRRRFIAIGLTGFALMIPLALTSTAGWIRRLGGRRWQMLHRLVYATAVCGVIPLLLVGQIRHSQAGELRNCRASAAWISPRRNAEGTIVEIGRPARSFPVARNLIEP